MAKPAGGAAAAGGAAWGARVAAEEGHGDAEGEHGGREQVAADGAPDQECGIYPKQLHEEPPRRVEAYVEQEEVAVLKPAHEAAGDPEQHEADERVPDALVEEGRVEGLRA